MGCTGSKRAAVGDIGGAKQLEPAGTKRGSDFSSLSKASSVPLHVQERRDETPTNHLKLQAGVVKDRSGKNAGRLDKKGGWFSAGNDRRGTFHVDGTVHDSKGNQVAKIDHEGRIWSTKRKQALGQIARCGSVLASNTVVGHVTADGAAFDPRGHRVGLCSAGKKQAAFIFFFEEKVGASKFLGKSQTR